MKEFKNVPVRLTTMDDKEKLVLEEYKKAINIIDDFFEYANESKKDREFIHEVLDNLTDKLTKIYNTQQDEVYYSSFFNAETFYKCTKHDLAYPRGATCPHCKREDED
jgi:hypothetical protein